MPSKKTAVRVYVTQDEYLAIARNAANAGLSMSCFAKRVCLGTPVPSRTDQQFRRELLQPTTKNPNLQAVQKAPDARRKKNSRSKRT